jgi:hypothetical protein
MPNGRRDRFDEFVATAALFNPNIPQQHRWT